MLYNKKCNSNPYYKQASMKVNTNLSFVKKPKKQGDGEENPGGSNGQFFHEGGNIMMQTQKNYARSCSSTESVLNTSSTTIFGKVKSLSEVKNP